MSDAPQTEKGTRMNAALKVVEASPPAPAVQKLAAQVETAEGNLADARAAHRAASDCYSAAALALDVDGKGTPDKVADLEKAALAAAEIVRRKDAALVELKGRHARAVAEEDAIAKREAHERKVVEVTQACNDLETLTRTWFDTLRQGDEQARAVMNGFYALFDLAPRLSNLTPEGRQAQMTSLHHRLTELHEGHAGVTAASSGAPPLPSFADAKDHLLDLIGYARKV